MQFTNFGQTGLTVSRMILGTGTFGKQTDEQEAQIKVSGRLSVKTVLARAYLELVSARVRSCFSRSARFSCDDGT
jgi:hypothetical protein